MHDHGPGGPEPGLERGDPGELVSLPRLHVGTGLKQVLLHVIPEVVEQLDLLLQRVGVLAQGVVVLVALEVDVVDVTVKKRIVETNSSKTTFLKHTFRPRVAGVW